MNVKNRSEHNLQAKANEALNERAEALSGKTLDALKKARHAALNGNKGQWYGQSGALLWGGGGVVVASIVIVAMLLIRPETQNGFLQAGMEAFELMAMTEELEFYEEIDFYQWLDSQSIEGKKNS